MKELVKVNIIKQEKGNTEEDLLELVFDNDSKEYIALGDIMNFAKNKKEKSNWNELKEWLTKSINMDIDNFGSIESTMQDVLNKMKELEDKDEN